MDVEPRIPARKLKRARVACRIPEGAPVVGLVDLTRFGSAKRVVV